MNEKIGFAGGCFWGIEEYFRTTKGVKKTTVGYMGGIIKNPTYEQVCTDTTGHAEVVSVEFDPKKIGSKDLLEIFFKIHDPTQVNRQGPDVGTQYRSAIFYTTTEQKKVAEESIKKIQKNYTKKIATEIKPYKDFYEAEEYHQKYLMKKGEKVCH